MKENKRYYTLSNIRGGKMGQLDVWITGQKMGLVVFPKRPFVVCFKYFPGITP